MSKTKALSKKAIIKAVSDKYGLDSGDVDLGKWDGEYHWTCKVGSCFADTLAVSGNLSNWTLERWLEDFDSKEASLLGGNGVSLKSYIDSLNWSVEYE